LLVLWLCWCCCLITVAVQLSSGRAPFRQLKKKEEQRNEKNNIPRNSVKEEVAIVAESLIGCHGFASTMSLSCCFSHSPLALKV
ncbi:hypothetical protein PIB30_050738, partial [Stylosanthes scabra]|nr:hypothetical protein [Stylosanthes scabra]